MASGKQLASGGARRSQPASGGSQPAFGGGGTLADGVTPRSTARQCEPWESGYHMFRYTKMAQGLGTQGARAEMKRGEWNNGLIEAELAEHPLIRGICRMCNKLTNSAAHLHECDTHYVCLT